jgi:hypothetical protein
VHQHAHEVVGGLRPALLGDAGGVLRVAGEGGHGSEDGLFVLATGEAAQHVVGPRHQRVAVLGCHAERVADHDQREQRGDVPDEVARTLLAHPVDDLVAHAPDLRLLIAHALGCEPPVDQLAPVPVLGIVHVDHHRERPVVGADALRVRERRRVLGDGLQVGVAADAPHAVALVPVDGGVGPHPREGLVVIAGPELAADEVDGGVGGVVGARHGR